MATRTESILRALVGPDRQLPTIGMIAAGTGYSRSFLSLLLRGLRVGSIQSLSAVAGYLGVGLETLHATLRNPPQPPKPKPRKPPAKASRLILRGGR